MLSFEYFYQKFQLKNLSKTRQNRPWKMNLILIQMLTLMITCLQIQEIFLFIIQYIKCFAKKLIQIFITLNECIPFQQRGNIISKIRFL